MHFLFAVMDTYQTLADVNVKLRESSKQCCAFKDQQVSLNRDRKLWQTGPSLCRARGFHATSLECVSSTWASWPPGSAAQHRLTTFIRSLCLLCHIKTPHYLLLCHWNSAHPSFFAINLLNILSLFCTFWLCLSVCSLSAAAETASCSILILLQ